MKPRQPAPPPPPQQPAQSGPVDLSESVAGEEDPGASLDVPIDAPPAAPVPSPSPQGAGPSTSMKRQKSRMKG
jgi:hypothetical protein